MYMIVLVFNLLFFNRGKTNVKSNKRKKLYEKMLYKKNVNNMVCKRHLQKSRIVKELIASGILDLNIMI